MVSIADRFPASKKATPSKRDTEMTNGIYINNIPKSVKNEELMNLLKSKGLSEDITEEETEVVEKEKNKSITILNLKNTIVKELMSSFHFPDCHTKFFGSLIYCKPIRETTPTKSKERIDSSSTEKSSEKPPNPSADAAGDVTSQKDENGSSSVSTEEENHTLVGESPTPSSNESESTSDKSKDETGITKLNTTTEQQLSIPPGLNLSKSALKRLKKKQAEKNREANESLSPELLKLSEKKELMEEKWSNILNGGKHKLSPEDKSRSVKPRALSLHN